MRSRAIAFGMLVTSLALLTGACADDSLGPAGSSITPEGPFFGNQGVFLALDNHGASTGETVTFTVLFDPPEDREATPTGFRVDFRYDPERLEPVESLAPDDGGLRLVNLDAGAGLVKAAGASPEGMEAEVLFGLKMKVRDHDYVRGLELDILELDILERNFADIAGDVATSTDPVQGLSPVLLRAQPREGIGAEDPKKDGEGGGGL